MLRALRSRNFRLYFGGQLVSLVGTWMQMVAMSWLVYRLTDSAAMLGYIGFLSQIPTFVLAPLAGVVADRWNRRSMMVVTQTLAMLQAFLLAFLVWSGAAAVWQIIPLSLLLGVINAFDAPVRQAFTVDLVDRKEDMVNAIAVSSIMFNGARLIGPTVAGLSIAVIGEAGCFFLNGVSFLAVIVALFMMRLAPPKVRTRESQLMQDLKEGASYTLRSIPIRILLLFLALMSVVSMPLQTLMPVMTKQVLHGSAAMLGFLVGAAGVGSLIGGLYLAQRRDVLGLEKRIAFSAGLFGVAAVALGFTRSVWIALPLAVVAGLGLMVQSGSSTTLVQILVEDDKRGRVMSFHTMAFMGMMPFGSLLGGVLGDRIGAPATVLLSGVICLAGTLAFARQLDTWRQHAHPVYERIGVMGQDGTSDP
jgi:MFS family permease